MTHALRSYDLAGIVPAISYGILSLHSLLMDPAPRMPVKTQEAFLRKQLRMKKIDPDTVDLHALIDPSLSYKENYKSIMDSIGASQGRTHAIPACARAARLKEQVKDTETKAGIPELKAELKDSKTQCDCTQMGLYDPAPNRSIPPRWLHAMTLGIKRSSDVRNPHAIARNIWYKLSPSKKAQIRSREAKGRQFRYDLPLPDDRTTIGSGTVRMVKPFKLAEVQVNLRRKDYLAAMNSGIFSRMKRSDGTTALVARCKSPNKNVNIFVDKGD